jgi:hypothetical protein
MTVFITKSIVGYEAFDPPYDVTVVPSPRGLPNGPFLGMTGTAIGKCDRFVWVKFDQAGSYAPCDKPGVYGLHPDCLVSA